jgi:hypothetical protein
VYLFNICDSSSPGESGGVYTLPYGEAVEGKRHGYEDAGTTRTGRQWTRGVQWTRNADHPPDPKCPECHAPAAPPPRAAKEPRVHVPDQNLERYRRIMNLYRHVDRIGNTRSNRGDYAGANAAWSRADRIKTHAQTLRVPGRAGR